MRLEQAKRDYYRRRAKEEGYKSRAAFKLKQLNARYKLIRRGSKVVDLGSAPGGWLQVASELAGNVGLVVGVDVVPLKPSFFEGGKISKNVKFIEQDVTSSDLSEMLIRALANDKADCVLADLSPRLSGVWDMDHFRQIDLCMRVVDLLPGLLESGGSSVLKAFQGEQLNPLIQMLKGGFERVDISKPEASRKESSEVYLVGLGFSGQVSQQGSEPHRSGPLSEERSDSSESDW